MTLENLVGRILEKVPIDASSILKLLQAPKNHYWIRKSKCSAMTAGSRPQPLDSVSAASVRYRIAIGPHSGNRTLTLHDPSCIKTDKSPKPLTVDRDGFSLNAAVSCKPYQRERLERLCRYITRPAICLDRLNVKNDGQIQYELKNPFRNGATHILFSPLDFLGKLAALIPRPRHHLVRYHGIFAPNATD